MKKVILLALLTVFISCSTEDTTPSTCPTKTLTYKLYYPNNPIVKTYTNKICDCKTASLEGTNYLYVKKHQDDYTWDLHHYNPLESSTIPIEIISLK